MASIYNIDKWDDLSDGHGFVVHDVVSYGDYFWYCIQAHELSSSNAPVIGSVYWGGLANIMAAGINRTWPYFFWPSSYNITVAHTPRIISVQLGDGYEQRMPDGLNHDRLEFQLTFEKRTETEARAIIHFLSVRRGTKAFYFKTPTPYGVVKKFICKTWSSSLVYEDNHTVTATFTEKS